MKKILVLFIALVMVSCASTKKMAMVPVGNWDYTITGTPNGDFSGVLMVTMDGENYMAILKSEVGEIKFDQTKFDQATKKLTGSFDFQGTPIDFESTTEGDVMKGWVSAGGGSWPFNGTRKK
jgi:hypothetical protein